ncbi:peptidoglycan DD-metalloendopeptidase family protein [Candidatus Sumerlaeota bacterium]|nr:peptidoglycan DD-metalloendopeptidase family protein [Candidatus Sumerlaeota bacterium]
MHRLAIPCLVALMLLLGQQGAFAGFYHTVRPGDSLSSIARKYGVSTAMIKMSNQLSDSPTLAVGTKLWIEGRSSAPSPRFSSPPASSNRRITPYPGTSSAPYIHKAPPHSPSRSSSRGTSSSPMNAPPPRTSARATVPSSRASAPAPAPPARALSQAGRTTRGTRPSDLEDPKDDSTQIDVPGGGRAIAPPPAPVGSSSAGRSIKPSNSGFIWPVEGRVTRRFTSREDEKYSGIDISIPRGTEVRASSDGRVLYASDRIPAYGRMIIIQHKGGLATCYGQNSQLLVREGQPVSRGQVIARSGDSGRGGEAYLHFELRKNGNAVNPEPYLP